MTACRSGLAAIASPGESATANFPPRPGSPHHADPRILNGDRRVPITGFVRVSPRRPGPRVSTDEQESGTHSARRAEVRRPSSELPESPIQSRNASVEVGTAARSPAVLFAYPYMVSCYRRGAERTVMCGRRRSDLHEEQMFLDGHLTLRSHLTCRP